MGWEIGVAIIIFASVYGLLRISGLLTIDEGNPTQKSIVQGLKIYLIIVAMLIMMGGVLITPNMIELSVEQDDCTFVLSNTTDFVVSETQYNYEKKCFDLTNSSTTTSVQDVTRAIYQAEMFTFIPFLLFLFILFIFTFITFLARLGKGKKEGGNK